MKNTVWTYSAFLACLAFSASASANELAKCSALPDPAACLSTCSAFSEKMQGSCVNMMASKQGSGTAVTPPVVTPTTTTTTTTTTTLIIKPPGPTVTPPKPPVQPPSVGKYQGPAREVLAQSGLSNQQMFAQYCLGDASSPAVPQPNYNHKDVRRAAQIMSKVADLNIYYYGDLKRIYKAGAPKAEAAAQFSNYASEINGYTENAHLYLVQTCGEFRDRAEMIQAKVNWVNDMVYLGSEPQKPLVLSNDPTLPGNQNVWSQVSGHSYAPYLTMSLSVYQARAQQAASDTYLKANLHKESQKAADGFTICETKYILSEYVAKKKSFDSMSAFESGYQAFAPQCLASDKDYYYDFRGDSNFKQYSPEANAMIWQAISVARHCESPTKAKGTAAAITDQVCSDYFSKPFLSRYNAARSGLGAWMLYSDAEKAGFQNQGLNVTVFPSFDIKNLGTAPFQMKLSDGSTTNSQVELKDGTLGFNKMFQIGSPNPDLSGAFERLRNAVNRHTNWYASAFDDGLGSDKSKKDQAYSPFVASSYEMSASNGFTECGVTVQCQGDGRKAWMLVFKVKKDNWYNTSSLAANKPLNFDRMWFDETTFGTDHLADSERAWDRLGTALEDELATILYLHNLEAGSGVPVANEKFE